MRIVIPGDWVLLKAMKEEGQSVEAGRPKLSSWAIFFNPADAPGRFVIRRFEGIVPTAESFTEDTLDAARAHLPEGLFCFARHPDDHPTVIEVWL